MESSRYNQAAEAVGVGGAEAEKNDNKIHLAHQKEEERRRKKEQKRNELRASSMYSTLEWVKHVFDDYYLDAIIGFVPGFGDVVTTFMALPFINFCIFKVKSLPLTLAVLNNYMIDMILGMIPYFIGNIIDFFYKAHRKNLDLIVGYINDDQSVIDDVNRKAFGAAIFLAFLIFVFVMMIKLVAGIFSWIGGLFS